jgi:hypothetical protein
LEVDQRCRIRCECPAFIFLTHCDCLDVQLTHNETNEEVARFIQELIAEGIFAGERKSCLRIQPCSVDLDLIVLSCLIMEKKRRDHAGDGTTLAAHDEDPQGDGGGGLG